LDDNSDMIIFLDELFPYLLGFMFLDAM